MSEMTMWFKFKCTNICIWIMYIYDMYAHIYIYIYQINKLIEPLGIRCPVSQYVHIYIMSSSLLVCAFTLVSE